MSIPLNFGLWWSGSKLSYLRYLTFKSLRHFHPRSRIQLFTTSKWDKTKGSPDNVIQDFIINQNFTDYMGKLKELDVEVINTKYFDKYYPNFQSDLFRWWFLRDNGGFYLDTDQIVLQPFDTLPLEHEFIYSSYKVESKFAPDGKYSPVGILGGVKDSKIVHKIATSLMGYYDKDRYCSLGPDMFRDIIRKLEILSSDKYFNAPHEYFYPASICDKTDTYFNGESEFDKKNYCFHIFLGYNKSQEFNSKYTEEFAKTSNDTISRFLRNNKII